ncbi:MAG: stalk domain-containing protein [Gudongella sp.]|nr:stalk domain-containing protein [Gudongella sp.]
MNRFIKLLTIGTLAMMLTIFNGLEAEAAGMEPIRLVVDGKDITHLTEPIIENGRTLVPIRFVTEEIGGEVSWDNETRTVKAWKGDRSLRMIIGSRVVELGNGKDAVVSDVAPRIIESRTFVPLRLISNGLGIGVSWDNATRTVTVDSDKSAAVEPFYNLNISSHKAGSYITGTSRITVTGDSNLLKAGNQLRLLLLDKADHKGYIIGMSDAATRAVEYIPEVENTGDRMLVAGVYDQNGNFLGGDSIPVSIRVIPEADMNGLVNNMVVSSAREITPRLNFAPYSVKYVFTNLSTGRVKVEENRDPYGPYTWNPMSTDSGLNTVQIIALDHDKNEYPGKIYTVNVQVPKRMTLSGVSEGTTIRNPVTLMANRNFDVRETTFLMRDPSTGMETVIQTIPYGTYTWFPGPEISGGKDLMVRVIDSQGNTVTSEPVRVNFAGTPQLQLQGIGPKQVVTGQAELTYRSNVEFADVEFVLTNRGTGETRTLSADPETDKAVYIPQSKDTGDWRILARGSYNGRIITSETVDFEVYAQETFGPYSVVPKDQFKSFAAGMAVQTYRRTGMSAAIQTSQAILETGWGQYVPRDKYTGKKSENLFGIKGSASNGSVTSNTLEVYNGVTYRIDAQFRAYLDPSESWNDHKLLLQKERYGIFRDVMYNSTMGAWAIRRAGYATDPGYPIKLMDIIRVNNLREFDKVTL